MTDPRCEKCGAELYSPCRVCGNVLVPASVVPSVLTANAVENIAATLRASVRGSDHGRARLEQIEALRASHASLASQVESLTTERDRLEQRSREGHAAHAASFGALQAISMLTDLEGEVDDYAAVVEAVQRAIGE